jgi:hypothetical protein
MFLHAQLIIVRSITDGTWIQDGKHLILNGQAISTKLKIIRLQLSVDKDQLLQSLVETIMQMIPQLQFNLFKTIPSSWVRKESGVSLYIYIYIKYTYLNIFTLIFILFYSTLCRSQHLRRGKGIYSWSHRVTRTCWKCSDQC